MDFFWFSEYTAIVSLNFIDWLVFVVEMQYAFFHVETKYLSNI
jgi:hypothetical protein